MRQDVKELADAMERGWEMCPRNTEWAYCDGPVDAPTACCPMGHAFIGAGLKVSCREGEEHFPILGTQLISDVPGARSSDVDLSVAIATLHISHHWSTPQVVAWLRTKEEKSE